MVATALPAVVVASLAGAANRKEVAARTWRRAAGVTLLSLGVTAPLWVLVLLRGVLYPAFGNDNLSKSWGGPSVAGAWAVHLTFGMATLLIVSIILAWWRPPSRPLTAIRMKT